MRTLYDILGISRTADERAIKDAYRTLAKRYHPDRNPGDKATAERFKEISAAYALLSDESLRAQYDRGEIDGNGQPRYQHRAPHRAPGQGQQGQRHFADFDVQDAENLFSDFFRFTRGAGGRQASGRRRGQNTSHDLVIGFEEALSGTRRRITLADGRQISVTIPAGIEDGQVIRLAAQGEAGFGGGPPGDALVEVAVAPHPYFTRKGLDLYVEIPISLDEAVLGAVLDVPVPGGTPGGRISVRVPPNSSSGRRLRLKGKGVAGRGESGHLYVVLKLLLPPEADPALEQAVRAWLDADNDAGGNAGNNAGGNAGDKTGSRAYGARLRRNSGL